MTDKHSYNDILKSSALIGSASVLTIAIGIIRTKSMAILLGPAGFGLMALYGSIIDLALSVAGMGIANSGVRQIAEANSSGEPDRMSRTVAALRRTSILLGILGAVLVIVFARQISTITFGSDEHANATTLVSLAVLFRLISLGQGAVFQGARRIYEFAAMGVLGAALGTTISIALVYTMGEAGIAPSLVAGAAMGLLISSWYSRKVRVEVVRLTRSELRLEVTELLKLGFAFMASGLLMMGASFAVRAMVLRMVGLDATGLYQSAWTLGALYVEIILQAMGTDFYPRLVGVVEDRLKCNQMVNEQAQVSMLLAAPGVIATLTFAPIVITLFYTSKFDEAVEVLRWICLGVALRVITWPMGFIVVAKKKPALFLGAELAWAMVNVTLTWQCVRWWGLNGAGIAFFGSYVFHGLMIYPIVRALTGFSWTVENRKLGLLFLFSIGIVFCGFFIFSPLMATVVGALFTVVSGCYSVRVLLNLVSLERLPRPAARLLSLFSYKRSYDDQIAEIQSTGRHL